MYEELLKCFNFIIHSLEQSALLTSVSHMTTEIHLDEQQIPYEDLDQFKIYKFYQSNVLSINHSPILSQQSIIAHDEDITHFQEQYKVYSKRQHKVELLWNQLPDTSNCQPTRTKETTKQFSPKRSLYSKSPQRISIMPQKQAQIKQPDKNSITRMHKTQFNSQKSDLSPHQSQTSLRSFKSSRHSPSPMNQKENIKSYSNINATVKIKLDIQKFIQQQEHNKVQQHYELEQQRNKLLYPEKSKSRSRSPINSLSKCSSGKEIKYTCSYKQGVSHININLYKSP